MDTPPPAASRFFYTLAIVLGCLAFAVLLVALFGAGWAASQDVPWATALIGIPGILGATGLAIATGLLAAAGAAIHDLRRIADHTSHPSLRRLLTAVPARVTPPAPEAPGATVAYYYVQNGVEHGPVNRTRLAELLRSKRVTPFERIEKSVNGEREPFDPREFGF